MDETDNLARIANDESPLVPHTAAGRLFSAVRRMKAEKELDIPVNHRTAFVLSTERGRPANQLALCHWEELYSALCDRLKRECPELHQRLFA